MSWHLDEKGKDSKQDVHRQDQCRVSRQVAERLERRLGTSFQSPPDEARGAQGSRSKKKIVSHERVVWFVREFVTIVNRCPVEFGVQFTVFLIHASLLTDLKSAWRCDFV